VDRGRGAESRVGGGASWSNRSQSTATPSDCPNMITHRWGRTSSPSCTHGRACILEDPQIRAIVNRVWRWTTKSSPENAGIDFVTMPNHVHGIVWIQESNAVGAQHPAYSLHSTWAPPSKPHVSASVNSGAAPLRSAAALRLAVPKGSLAAIVRTFKSVATQRINAVRGTLGAPVWQRNYYEHVTRSDAELGRIREYIANNPLKWQLDLENPDRVPDVAYEREWEWLEGASR